MAVAFTANISVGKWLQRLSPSRRREYVSWNGGQDAESRERQI